MIDIVVPPLGESVVDARVARWLKQPGDRVNAGDAVVELETEKIDLEVSADRAGVLARIDRRDGEDVKIGDRLGVIDESQTGPVATAPEAASRDTQPDGPHVTDPATPDSAQRAAPAPAGTGRPAKATPTARRIASDHDIALEQVEGSGPAGRVTKRDVQRALTQPDHAPAAPLAKSAGASAASEKPPRSTLQPTPGAERRPAPDTAGEPVRREERQRMSKRRATIARRLVEAQHAAAMLTTFNEIDMTALQTLRRRHKEAFTARYGSGLGVVSFFVKTAIAALRAFPRLNAEIQGDEIVVKHYYDIGVAVGAEGGLVVPVLRDADRMSFAAVEIAIRDAAARAERGSLSLEDLRGGTFTITNGGVFGSLLSTPILNPPQVGILGLHKIEDRPVAIAGQVAVRPMMYVALSYDHRIVDGREAVQFLVRIKDLVEDPGVLLVES